MDHRRELEKRFSGHGFRDFKWLDPKEIVVSDWVRMKCRFGCREFGRTAVCPPQVPSVGECRRFFRDYSEAVVFHFKKQFAKPEDRFAWTKGVNQALLKLEREVFLSGREKAFLLFMDSCNLCETCVEKKEDCKQPKAARPAPEALAVDVFSTVRKLGYPIEVLPDTVRVMNRYAFLLIA